MAIAFRSATNAIITGTSQAVTKPAGTVDGDIIVVMVGPSNTGTLTPPNGTWTQLNANTCIKIAASEPATWTFSGISGAQLELLAIAYSGAGGWGNQLLTFSTAGTAHTVGGIAITEDGSKAVAAVIAGSSASAPSFTSPGTLTERYDASVFHGFRYSGVTVADVAMGIGTMLGGNITSSVSCDGAARLSLELTPIHLSGAIVAVGSVLTANLLKTGELGGAIRSTASSLSGTAMTVTAALEGTIGGTSEFSATMTGVPNFDFTVYDCYIDDGTDVVGYIEHDTDATRAADQSLKLQPIRQDVGNNPAEIRPDSGDLFAETDFSHGDGQEYFHHTGRDPRKFLHSEGFDISIAGKLTHLHACALANPAAGMGDIVVANGFPFHIDGQKVFIGDGTFPGVWTEEDWDATEARNNITSATTSGKELFIATDGAPGNGIHKRDSSGVWTHYVNDTTSLGFSQIAWVKDRLMAVSGTAVYEITASGALPTAIETLAPGWVANAIFESGGFIYVCWENVGGGLSQINHYGLNSAATAIEKKGSTPLPQGQFARSGYGYLNTIFIGIGRLNDSGGYDPVLYQGVADSTGIIDYVKVVEEKGSLASDLSIAAICPLGEAVLYGWSLSSRASTGVEREGLGIFHLGLAAHAHHLSSGVANSRRIVSIAIYKGRVLFGIAGVGLFYEDMSKFTTVAEMVPSVADWSNAGLKVWDRLELAHSPLAAEEIVTLEYTTKHPDEADWHPAITSNVDDSEGAVAIVATATSRLFDVRIRSYSTVDQIAAPTFLGFAVRSNPAPAVPEYQMVRTFRLFSRDRKDDTGETVDQDPDAMKEHLQSLAYKWVKLYEPDATWTARVESVSTLEPAPPKERVTAGEAARSAYVMQVVLTGTRGGAA